MEDGPPPPPPHGENPQNAPGAGGGGRGPKRRGGGLPDGNYDIFIVPPHSSGGGFVYFPSLQPQRNSFIAGSLCTFVLIGVWSLVFPVMKEWFLLIVASGGAGVALLLICVGGAAWAIGRLNLEQGGRSSAGKERTHEGNSGGGGPGAGAKSYAQGHGFPGTGTGFNPNSGPPPEPPPGSGPGGGGGGGGFAGGYYQHTDGFEQGQRQEHQQQTDPNEERKKQWEKQREEIRKKNEQRKKEEEAKRRLDEYRKRKQEEAEAKKKQQEKEEQERQQQRDKEQKEREQRERRERLQKEREEREKKNREERERQLRERIEAREKELREKELREKELREKEAREKSERAASDSPSPKKPSNFRQATAHTEIDPEEMYSFRPYDKPKARKTPRTVYTSTSASSFSPSSYAASDSTSRTTPPPVSREGTYTSSDPDAIVIKGAYAFNNVNGPKPMAELTAGAGNVSVGLVLRITTEGIFIDDEARGSPQREWDTKAWTLKMVETGDFRGLHIIRTNIRDMEGKKFVFVYMEQEKKAKDGLQRLRKGPNTRGLAISMLENKETKAILEKTGWA